jgi:hypothetical protein
LFEGWSVAADVTTKQQRAVIALLKTDKLLVAVAGVHRFLCVWVVKYRVSCVAVFVVVVALLLYDRIEKGLPSSLSFSAEQTVRLDYCSWATLVWCQELG